MRGPRGGFPHRRSRDLLLAGFAVVLALAAAAAGHAGQARSAAAGIDRTLLARIDGAVREAVAAGDLPGAVVLVWHDGHTVYRKAFGLRAVVPEPEPMTVDTIFDLASLTKVVATTTAVMMLVDEGRVRL
ncbi:MAG: serine hydrolase, partial [Acidobacteriota bacterium]|nr:serine hydrolase [Acidobacteriota bacterium]